MTVMKVFTLSLIFLISALLITSCNTPLTGDTYSNPNLYGQEEIESAFPEQELGWARENLDLRAIGELIEEADNAEELEYLLNSRDGVNNMDLNGDGYVDYISVREFDDRYDDERGFSFYSMFGSDAIQEILTVVFDRDGYGRYDDGYDEYGYRYPGSRVLIIGDDMIYGDDYYYEANWVDRPVTFVDWVFSDRDYYRSPYYYGYYPDYYQPYTIVETTVYRTRIEQYYYDSTPAFVYTTQPTVTEIRIESPYRDRSLDRIYANLAKPTKEQVDFLRNDPTVSEVLQVRSERIKEGKNSSEGPERAGKPERFERSDSGARDNPNKLERAERVRGERPEKFDRSGGSERDFSGGKPEKVARDNPNRAERPEKSERAEKSDRPGKFERAEQVRIERPQKQERPNKAERFENRSNPGRVERQNSPRVERQQPQRTERPQPVRVERPNQQRVERPQPNRVERPSQQRTERPQPVRVERPRPQQQQQVQRQSPPQQVQRQQPAKVERPKPQQEQRVAPQGGGGNGKGKGKP
jgi:hypothetical protein